MPTHTKPRYSPELGMLSRRAFLGVVTISAALATAGCQWALQNGSPAIWVMDADVKNPRLITRGVDDLGADHPRWL